MVAGDGHTTMFLNPGDKAGSSNLTTAVGKEQCQEVDPADYLATVTLSNLIMSHVEQNDLRLPTPTKQVCGYSGLAYTCGRVS